MKKACMRILACILILALMGGTTMAEELIAPERLLELSGLTQEDIELAALREIIRRFGVTEESVAGAPAEELAAEVRAILESDYLYDDSYLLETPVLLRDAGAIEASDVRRVAVFQSLELMSQAALIDLGAREIRVGSSLAFFSDIRMADGEGALTEEGIRAIREALEGLSLKDYASSAAEDAALAACGLIVETEDGVVRCLAYGPEGVPEELAGAVHAILSAAFGGLS